MGAARVLVGLAADAPHDALQDAGEDAGAVAGANHHGQPLAGVRRTAAARLPCQQVVERGCCDSQSQRAGDDARNIERQRVGAG